MLLAVLPAFTLSDDRCPVHVIPPTIITCGPSNIQCLDRERFTLCINMRGASAILDNIYRCPPNRECVMDANGNEGCKGPLDNQPLPMPVEIVQIIQYLRNMKDLPTPPENVSWVEVVQAPQIIMLSRTYDPILGTNVTISCEVIGVPEPHITWMRGDMVITNQTNPVKYVINPDQTLTVSFVERGDTGEYKCKADNGVGYPVFNIISITVAQIQENPPTFVEPGYNVVLLCDAKINHDSFVTWQRNGAIILYGEKYKLYDDYSLQITDANKNDGGKYDCVVTQPDSTTYTVRTAVTVSQGFTPPRIVPSIENVGCLGGIVNLRCPVAGNPIPKIIWLRNNYPVDISSTKYRINEDDSLTIYQVMQPDAGIYVCSADNEIGKPLAVDIQLRTTYCTPPVIVQHNPTLVLQRGQNVHLDCFVTGIPKPKVQWSFHGQEITPMYNVRYVLNPDGTMDIRRAEQSDSGAYKCVARNDIGQDITNIVTVVVESTHGLVPPVFVVREPYIVVSTPSGEPVTLDCKAMGNPMPIILWKKDGMPVTQDKNHIINADQTLTIRSADASDGGTWTCTAINNVGPPIDKETILNVGPQLPSTQFRNITEMKIYRGLEGTMAVLECSSVAYPPPIVSWYRDGIPIRFGFTSRYSLTEANNLQITNLEQTDAGEFWCTALNPHGALNYKITVYVYKPSESYPPIANATALRLLQEVVEESEVTLRCAVSGNPPPRITWLKDGTPLENSDDSVTINSDQSLTLRRVDQQVKGQYQCRASNDFQDVGKIVDVEYNITVLIVPTTQVTPPQFLGAAYIPVLDGTLGCDLLLICPVVGVPRPRITWQRGKEIINNFVNPRYSILQNDSLKISPLLQEDADQWLCVANNNVGSSLVVYFRVTVANEETRSLSPIMAIKGTELVLKCPLDVQNVVWLKENRLIYPGDPNMQFQNGNKNLVILKPDQVDSGHYTCMEDTKCNNRIYTYHVDVGIAPTIIDEWFPTISVVENGTIILNCSVYGYPRPKITWTKDGEPINMRHVLTKDQSLLILDITKADGGVYSCVADNGLGTPIQRTTTLIITEPLIIDLVQYTPALKITVEQDIVLKCAVTGTPAPKVTWIKGNVPVDTSTDRVVIDQEALTLTISQSELSDEGQYHCFADNGVSKVTVSITVQILPSKSPPERCPECDTNPVGKLGEPIQLVCPVTANPPAQIKWFKGANPITETDPNYTINPNGTLSVHKVGYADAGTYICVADNGIPDPISVKMILIVKQEQGFRVSKFVFADEDIMLKLSCHGVLSAIWTKNKQKFEYVVSPDNALVFPKIKKGDGGVYTCANDLYNIEYTVIVAPKPVSDHVILEIISQAEDTTLVCSFSGGMEGEKLWVRENAMILHDGIKHIINPDNSLTIKNVQKSDTGQYFCIDKTTNVQYEYQVVVDSSKLIRSILVEVPLGTTIVLMCTSNGQSSKHVMWDKNGQQLPIQPTSPTQTAVAGPSTMRINPDYTLSIVNIDKSSEGEYTCYSDAEINRYVLVSIKPVEEQQITTITILAATTSNIVLVCKIPGDIVWKLGSGQEISDSSPKYKRLTVSALGIMKVEKKDQGVYICQDPVNKHENRFIVQVVDSQTGMTSVLYNLLVPGVPLGSKVILDCALSGPLSGSVAWFKDNAELDLSTDKYRLGYNKTLVIINFSDQDAGTYVCKITPDDDSSIELMTITNYFSVLYEPTVSYMPGNALVQPVPLNKTVTLNCWSKPGETVMWFKNGIPILQDYLSNIRINTDLTLTIATISKEDDAVYECVIRNMFSLYPQKHIFLIVTYGESSTQPSSPIQKLDDYEVVVIKTNLGSVLTLDCGIKGPIYGNVNWIKDFQVVITDENHVVRPDQTLEILNTDISDQGRYFCKARSVYGKEIINVFEIEVDVNNPDPPGHIIVTTEYVGNLLQLKCAEGIVGPVMWTKNDVMFQPNDNQVHLRNDIIEIESVKKSDAAIYVCRSGLIKNTFIVIVPKMTDLLSGTAKVITVYSGSTLWLKCPSSQQATSKILWSKEDQQIQNDDRDNRIKVLFNGILEISNATNTDSGPYTCLHFDREQLVGSTFIVRVVRKPSETGRRFIKLPVATCDTNINFNCNIPGRVAWTKNNIMVTSESSHMYVKPDQSLQINRIQKTDEGVYECTVNSNRGTLTGEYILTVECPEQAVVHQIEYEQIVLMTPQNYQVTLESTIMKEQTEVKTIIWTKDGIQLPPNDPNFKVMGPILQITDITHQYYGMYTATVETTKGERYIIDFVVVPNPVDEWDLGRNVAIMVQSVYHTRLTLNCGDPQKPAKRVIWFSDDQTVTPSPSYIQNPQNKLVIQSVEDSDEAVFICKRDNPDGTRESYTFSVIVNKQRSLPDIVSIVPVELGQPVLLKCGAPNRPWRPLGEAMWAKDNKVIDFCNRKKFTTLQNHSLVINSFEPSDAGEYKCIASYFDKSRTTNKLMVSMVNPSVTEEYVLTNVGTILSLQCSPNLSYPTKITWTDSTGRLLSREQKLKVYPDGRLIVHEVETSTSRFTCVDPTSGIRKTFTIQLPPFSPPTMIVSLYIPEMTKLPDTSAKLFCPITGNPVPLITWTMNGNKIVNKQDKYRLNDDQTLQINHLQGDDEGSYSCQAINEFGELTTNLWLNIGCPTNRHQLKLEGEIGRPITIPCGMANNLQPIWSKGNMTLRIDGVKYNKLQSQLLVNSLEESDFGVYTCQRFDDNGQLMETMDTNVVNKLGSIVLWVEDLMPGATVNIKCRIPPNWGSSITWTKNGYPVMVNNVKIFITSREKNILTIMKFGEQDYGEYKCMDSNTMETVTYKIYKNCIGHEEDCRNFKNVRKS